MNYMKKNRINEGDAYGQIFEKTVRLFDKIAELLGDTKMSVKEFYEIVDTGLSDIEVGVVPPTVDRVLIGDITRSRLNHIKVLFFTSVNDGIVPKAPKKGRILSDRDRDILSDCGLELAPSDKQNSYIEQFYIYTILMKPSDHLYISYHKLSASLEKACVRLICLEGSAVFSHPFRQRSMMLLPVCRIPSTVHKDGYSGPRKMIAKMQRAGF